MSVDRFLSQISLLIVKKNKNKTFQVKIRDEWEKEQQCSVTFYSVWGRDVRLSLDESQMAYRGFSALHCGMT